MMLRTGSLLLQLLLLLVLAILPADVLPTTMATDVTDVATDATMEGSCVPKYVASKPSCTIDTTLVMKDGSISVPFSVGISRVVCGRLYFLSWLAKTREDAEKTCCSLGMTLVSMDDATKSQCLADYYKSLAFMPTTFWTSGADVGCPGQWTWSNTAQTFAPGIKWAPGQPNDTGMCVESAMSVDPPATLLSVKTCASTNKFICQKAALEPATITTPAPPKTAHPTGPGGVCLPSCPVPKAVSCALDKRMVGPDGNLSIPFSVGVAKVVCGRLYVLSWIAKTLDDALLTCCSLNMTLVSMEDATMSQCLADYYKSLSFAPTTFWTSGTDGGCPGKWIWCNTETEFAKGIQWAPGEPKNIGAGDNGACVQTSMSTGVPAASLLSVTPCALTNRFICQKAVMEPGYTTAAPAAGSGTGVVPAAGCATCNKPVCTLNTKMVDPNGTVTIGLLQGKAMTTCGRQYMFSTMMSKNYTDAEQYCCSLGMKLVAFETPQETTCLVTALMTLATMMAGMMPTGTDPTAPTYFWTSASDAGCEGKWSWCSTGAAIVGANWTAGTPDTTAAGINKNCGMLSAAIGGATLMDGNCSAVNKFICEGDAPGTTTTVAAGGVAVTNLQASATNPPAAATTVAGGSACPMSTCYNPTCSISQSNVSSTGLVTVNANFGVAQVLCGKQYFFSSVIRSYKEAADACCALGMKLVTLETMAEVDCILLPSTTTMYHKSGFVWTSGANVGCGQDYKWCSTGATYDRSASKIVPWGDGQPVNVTSGNCMTAMLADGIPTYLNTYNCTEPIKFICEGDAPGTVTTTTPAPTCTGPKCVAPSCSINPLYFATGTLSVPATTGNVVPICNAVFMIGKEMKTLAEAADMCCSMAMELATFEAKSDAQCIADNLAKAAVPRMLLWTGGTDHACLGKWGWCHNGTSTAFDPANSIWAAGSPAADTVDECAVLAYSPGDASINVAPMAYLNTMGCQSPNNYICKGNTVAMEAAVKAALAAAAGGGAAPTAAPTSAAPTTTTTPSACSPSCPSVTCDKDPQFFDANGKLDPSKTMGQVMPACNSMYFFGKSSMNQNDAVKACCNFGMRLLSVETSSEASCLADFIVQMAQAQGATGSTGPTLIWTSARSHGCKSTGPYVWCNVDVKTAFSSDAESVWGTGEPTNKDDCASLEISANPADPTDINASFKTQSCGDKLTLLICEATSTASG